MLADEPDTKSQTQSLIQSLMWGSGLRIVLAVMVRLAESSSPGEPVASMRDTLPLKRFTMKPEDRPPTVQSPQSHSRQKIKICQDRCA